MNRTVLCLAGFSERSQCPVQKSGGRWLSGVKETLQIPHVPTVASARLIPTHWWAPLGSKHFIEAMAQSGDVTV